MPKSSRILFLVCFSLIVIGAGFCTAGIFQITWPLFVGVASLVAAIIIGVIAFCLALSYDDKVNCAEKEAPKAH
jgi:uncharacterized membrane protein (DUF485 family)